MSKLITTRYEFVTYDDAQGVLSPANQLPPTYPPVIDQYTYATIASAGSSYGVFNFSNSGNTQISVPAGATLIVTTPVTNTQFVYLTLNVPLVLQPGTTPTNAPLWPCAPGQTVTYPGALNSVQTPILVRACDSNLAQVATPNFSCTIMWSL